MDSETGSDVPCQTYWTKTYWAQNILGNILDQNIFIPKHIVPKTYSYQNILEPKHIRPKTYWTIICIISTMGFYTLFFRLLQWIVFYHRFMLFFGFLQWIVLLNRHARDRKVHIFHEPRSLTIICQKFEPWSLTIMNFLG